MNDTLVDMGQARDFWSVDAFLQEPVPAELLAHTSVSPAFWYAGLSGPAHGSFRKQFTGFKCASSSSAPPPLESDPPSAESDDETVDWEQLSLKTLAKLSIGHPSEEIRQLAVDFIATRYRRGNQMALVTLARCSKDSEVARSALHVMVAGNDLTFRHLQMIYENVAAKPGKLRTLLFAFRSLANRINDDVAEQFEQLAAMGKMQPLSDNKIHYFNQIIFNLDDGYLSDWARHGSEDAAEELLLRYLSLRSSPLKEEQEDAESALVELADAAHQESYALELLFRAGSQEVGIIESEVWDEIAALVPKNRRAVDILATGIEAGYRGHYYTTLRNAAMESPYAALRLYTVIKHFHEAGEFHLRDQALIDLMDINLLRYREFAQTDPQAVEALVRLHQLGARQARPTLEFVAPHHPLAQAALDKLDRDKST